MGIKITKKDTIYKSKFLDVVATSFIGNDGKEGVWEYVNKKKDVSSMIAFTEDNKVVIIRQFRLPIESYILQLPVGLIDEGEEPGVAAKREFLEETGYTVDTMFSLDVFPLCAGTTNMRVHLFGGLNAKKVAEPKHETAEDIEVILLSKDELLSLVGKEQISTGLLSAWFLMENHLKSK